MESLSLEDEVLLGEVTLPTQGSLRIAGPSHETAKVVRDLLQINHVKYDWQFTEDGLHNHLSHSILAAFSLGASPDLIHDTFDFHSKAQRPMCTMRRRISFQNWTHWLGQSEYYSSYLAFFVEEIKKYGAAATIERYLFTYREGEMLIRSVSGAIHPLIQIGHGVEFRLDALVAEGLAQACVHSPQVAPLFNEGWPHDSPPPPPTNPSAPSAFSSAFSRFKSIKVPVAAAFSTSKDSFNATLLRINPRRLRQPRLGLAGFTIIAHMLKDPRLAAGQANLKDDFPRLGSALHNRGDLIRAWCAEWIVDPAGGWTEIVEKAEEIFWIATVLVGASSRPGYKPRMDFFMMHALTSAMFLPSLLEVLSPESRIQLLHSHFRVMIGYWISRGRPHLYIEETLMAATAYPCAPNSVPAEKGAIERGIEKEEEEKQKKAAETSSDSTTDTKDAQDGVVSDEAVQGQTNGSVDTETISETHVDVPLDSPVEAKETDPMHEVTLPPDEEEGDGHKTPTQSNGNGFSRPSSPKRKQRQRQAASSSAAWSDIITSAIDHTDEHVTKMVRSLVFAAQNYGMATPGVYRSALPGTDKMDGTIFIRLAGLLMQSMGWEHYGEPAGDWDRSVLGFDEAWQDETREILAFTAQEKGKGRANANEDFHPQAYQIGGNDRSRSNTIFDNRRDYPKMLEKGKGRETDGQGQIGPIGFTDQEKLERKYYEDDETDPHAFGEHQQWAEGVM